MYISKEKIKEIADQLDCGFRAFINTKTGKLIFIPDNNNFPGIEMSYWEEDLDELENNFYEYYEVEKWTSSQAFEMMCEFTNRLTDKNLRRRLIDALEKRKPFREFKSVIENSVNSSEEWFDFKNSWQREFVASQLNRENQETDDSQF